jgi:hypothetical protein
MVAPQCRHQTGRQAVRLGWGILLLSKKRSVRIGGFDRVSGKRFGDIGVRVLVTLKGVHRYCPFFLQMT